MGAGGAGWLLCFVVFAGLVYMWITSRESDGSQQQMPIHSVPSLAYKFGVLLVWRAVATTS
jgi:hypothetical protein